MTNQYNQKVVLGYLKKESLGILATYDKNEDLIRQRVMYYGAENNFNCYLMSTKGSAKIDQILSFSHITFIVFGLEDPYDQSWEIELNGEGTLLSKKTDIDIALDKLKGKNPFADVVIESDIIGQFDFIKVIPQIIRFRIYGEALKGEPVTIFHL